MKIGRLLLLLLVSGSAFAQDRFAITGSAVRSNSRTGATIGLGDTLRYGADTGYGIAFDYFWTRAISTQLAAASTKPALSERAPNGVSDFGEARMMPITASLLFHLAPMAWADVYAGGGAAWVRFSDMKSSPALAALDIDRVKFDSDAAAMAQVGAAFGSWRGVGLNVDARYANIKTKSRASFTDQTTSTPIELKVSPWLLSAGIRVRF